MVRSYLFWLIALSLLFLALERTFPWRKGQGFPRPGWGRDIGFLAINGYVFALLMAGVNGWFALQATTALGRAGITFATSPMRPWPGWIQFLVLLVVSDFLQWSIHFALHQIPVLWNFHKVHHAITTMDFIGSFRFHWMETVIYKAVQWLPISLLGASSDVAFGLAVFSTFWGHLNHSNLNVGLGPIGHLLNTPRMHLWHHDATEEGGISKNFGILLSVWDVLFRTAYWPRDRSPRSLGYAGIQEMPEGLLHELAWPLSKGPSLTEHGLDLQRTDLP